MDLEKVPNILFRAQRSSSGIGLGGDGPLQDTFRSRRGAPAILKPCPSFSSGTTSRQANPQQSRSRRGEALRGHAPGQQKQASEAAFAPPGMSRQNHTSGSLFGSAGSVPQIENPQPPALPGGRGKALRGHAPAEKPCAGTRRLVFHNSTPKQGKTFPPVWASLKFNLLRPAQMGKNLHPGITGVFPQPLFNAQELIVFGDPLSPAGSAGFDLAAAPGDG